MSLLLCFWVIGLSGRGNFDRWGSVWDGAG